MSRHYRSQKAERDTAKDEATEEWSKRQGLPSLKEIRSEAKAEVEKSRRRSMRGNKNASGHRLSFKARCELAKQMRARWKERKQTGS
jgi:hypothetical protein